MLDKNYEIKKCIYCGELATTVDHVVPVTYYYNGKRKGRHLTANYGKENLVDACRQCNSISGNKVFDNLDKKREFIQNRLKEKYRKVINMPFWSDEELKSMGRLLYKEIKIQVLAKKWVLNRINYPVEMYPVAEFNKQVQRFLEKGL